jgi:hypothetical protein
VKTSFAKLVFHSEEVPISGHTRAAKFVVGLCFRVEAGLNTSTVALRVVRRGEKGTHGLGVYLGHPVPGGYKYGDLVLQVGGVSRIGTIKYGIESRGTQTGTGLLWREPASTVNYRPVLSSERALQTSKLTIVQRQFQGVRKIGRGTQISA